MAKWIRRLPANPGVSGSIASSNSLCSYHNLRKGGAVAKAIELTLKLSVEVQELKAENTISVGHCIIP